MREVPESFTGRSLSHRRATDKRSVCHQLLHFCEQARRRLGCSMLPFPHLLGNDSNLPAKGKLAQPKQPAGFQNPIRRCLDIPRIHSEKANQSRPKGGCRGHLVTLPTLIMLPEGVQTLRRLRLGEIQDQPAGAKVLPQSFWLQNEPFMDEVSEPESRSGSLEREVAKWQNRVILTSPESDRLPPTPATGFLFRYSSAFPPALCVSP